MAAATAISLWQEQSGQSEAATQTGPFQPNWDSLSDWECPEWFRDAKFGIWAHWTAQCVPEMGDWYARQMYMQGNDDYNYQCAHYGHPSKVGFKDVDHMWHAEAWNPERLMGLYKAAGAKYFMALGQHHDNFDCYDSKHQPWNSVAIGPKKDIVGTWARVARAHDMHFAVSSHGSHAWSWYEVAQGADTSGPLAGVPYDGKMTKADGKGKWWDGLDPQDLYAQNHIPGTGGLQWDWEVSKGSSTPDAAYCNKFYNRITDLIDKYQPDLIYFDDTVMPLYQVDPSIGLRIASHLYNTNMKRNHGHLGAVMTGKGLSPSQRRAILLDIERGQSDEIKPQPWQTDTCIGSWHYDRRIYQNHSYKTPDQVVKMLVDIVSKNGNLMLNIPLKGDGTIDPDELTFLQGMAAWMAINEQAIFATRPWKISGEGVVRGSSGSFSEAVRPYTAQDLRFTTKGDVLYATALGWPDDGTLKVTTLATDAPGIVGDVRSVELLGHGPVPFTRTAHGLLATMPATKPCDHAYVLKITGLDMVASHPVRPSVPPIHAAVDGTWTLSPGSATLHGNIRAQNAPTPNIGYWDDPGDKATWQVHFDTPGTYAVTARVSGPYGDTSFVVDAGSGASTPLSVPKTASWDAYETVSGGVLKVDAAGDRTVTVGAADPAAWHAMNLASVTLHKERPF